MSNYRNIQGSRKGSRSGSQIRNSTSPANRLNSETEYSTVNIPIAELGHLASAVYSCFENDAKRIVNGWTRTGRAQYDSGLKIALYQKLFFVDSVSKVKVNVLSVAGTEDFIDLVVDMGLAAGTIRNSPVGKFFDEISRFSQYLGFLALKGSVPAKVYRLISRGARAVEDCYTNTQLRQARVAFTD